MGDVVDTLGRLYGEAVQYIRVPQLGFFAKGANAGIRNGEAKYVALINDDARVAPDWGDVVVGAFEAGIGSVASLVRQAADPQFIDSMGDHLSINGLAGGIGWNEPCPSAMSLRPTEVFSASACCAVYRRSAIEELGLFDEAFAAYLEDVDLGFRLRNSGFTSLFVPDAHAWHLGGATRKKAGYAAFLTERNLVWNVLKNYPRPLLRRHAGSLLSAVAKPAPLISGRSKVAWIRGKTASLAGVGRVSQQRSLADSVGDEAIDRLERLMMSRPVEICHL